MRTPKRNQIDAFTYQKIICRANRKAEEYRQQLKRKRFIKRREERQRRERERLTF